MYTMMDELQSHALEHFSAPANEGASTCVIPGDSMPPAADASAPASSSTLAMLGEEPMSTSDPDAQPDMSMMDSAQEHNVSGGQRAYVPRLRKPYTITKQREKWTEEEHALFLDSLQKHNRDWKKIHEYIKTKSIVQIRSHAQKFFLKMQKSGQLDTNVIPPPRPKRKSIHPYPSRKTALAAAQAGAVMIGVENDTTASSSAAAGMPHMLSTETSAETGKSSVASASLDNSSALSTSDAAAATTTSTASSVAPPASSRTPRSGHSKKRAAPAPSPPAATAATTAADETQNANIPAPISSPEVLASSYLAHPAQIHQWLAAGLVGPNGLVTIPAITIEHGENLQRELDENISLLLAIAKSRLHARHVSKSGTSDMPAAVSDISAGASSAEESAQRSQSVQPSPQSLPSHQPQDDLPEKPRFCLEHIYAFLGSLFDPTRYRHEDMLGSLSPIERECLRVLMHNLAITLSAQSLNEEYQMLVDPKSLDLSQQVIGIQQSGQNQYAYYPIMQTQDGAPVYLQQGW